MNQRQLNHIIAGLRLLQQHRAANDIPSEIAELATDDGEALLSVNELDALCMELNIYGTGEVANESNSTSYDELVDDFHEIKIGVQKVSDDDPKLLVVAIGQDEQSINIAVVDPVNENSLAELTFDWNDESIAT